MSQLFSSCSKAPIIFYFVEKETVQFDMLLLLRFPNVERNLKLGTRIY